MIEVKMIADSVSEFGVRICTLQLKYPRFIHSEFMTHRVFSRSASSSRAIPINKIIITIVVIILIIVLIFIIIINYSSKSLKFFLILFIVYLLYFN